MVHTIWRSHKSLIKPELKKYNCARLYVESGIWKSKLREKIWFPFFPYSLNCFAAKWSWRRKVLKNLKVVHIQNLLYWNMWINLMKLKTSRITRKPLGGLDFSCWGACRWKLSAVFLLSSMVFFFALSSSWGYIPRLNPHIICLTCNINLVRYFSKQGAENAKKLSEYSGKANRAYYFTVPVS